MTTQAITLELSPREVLGKKVRRLRRSGIMPVHLYGPSVEPRALQCATPILVEALTRAGGSTPITISVQGENGTQLAFAKEIQRDPRRDDIIHVDLVVAEASRPVTAQVPIVLAGDSPGARSSGGAVVHQLRDVSVEALPLEMPNELEVDLGEMVEADSVFRIADLKLPPNVSVLADPDDVVARIEARRVALDDEAAAEDVGAAEEVRGSPET